MNSVKHTGQIIVWPSEMSSADTSLLGTVTPVGNVVTATQPCESASVMRVDFGKMTSHRVCDAEYVCSASPEERHP